MEEKSYVAKKIAEVEKYLDEVNNKNQLNEKFEKYYLEKQQNMKNDVITTGWYNELSEKVKGILDGSDLYNYQIEPTKAGVFLGSSFGERVVEYKGCFNVKHPSILAQLCEIYKVKIKDEICNKLGSNLDQKFIMSARAPLNNSQLTLVEYQKMNNQWANQEKVANALEKACKELLTKLRQKIAEEHEGKFNFFELSPNKPKEWKWDDEAVYNLVSKLDEFKSNAKDIFLNKFREENEADDFDAKLEQPAPDLFSVLGDKNLKKYIDNYKSKSLEDRKKDPLRKVFRWNGNTQNYNLNKMKPIKQWFEKTMDKTLAEKDKEDIYFVLLELFGKDFEFGGGSGDKIPKVKLCNEVDEKEARKWYKKNMSDTDLFDDLQIEIEEEEKIVIEEKTEEDKLHGNIINENGGGLINKSVSKTNTGNKQPKTSETDYIDLQIEEEKIEEKTKEGKLHDNIRNKNCNDGLINKSNRKTNTGNKQPKTSKTGYIIGFIADVLITSLFVYLGLSSPLFFLALIITVPFGIFCVIKLCQGCLSVDNKKIQSPSISDDDFLYSETHEPEYVPDQNNILLEDLECNETIKEKPVKIVTKSY